MSHRPRPHRFLRPAARRSSFPEYRAAEGSITSVVEEVLRGTALDLVGRDVETCLHEAVEARVTALEADPETQMLLLELLTQGLRDPAMRDLADRQVGRTRWAARLFLETVADAAQIVWSRPVVELAAALAALVQGSTAQWLIDRDPERMRANLQSLIPYLVIHARPSGNGSA